MIGGIYQKKKTRRSKKIRNKLKRFTVIYANSRGIKSKMESLKEIVKEKNPV